MKDIYEHVADMFLMSATGQRSGVTREQVIASVRAKWPTAEAVLAGLDNLSEAVNRTVSDAQALREAGLKYRIVEAGRAIQCLTCGMTSWHAEDVRHRYCAKCGVFHDDVRVH